LPRQGALTGITTISANANNKFGLALRADGTVWAWGYNASGQLGNGTTNTGATSSPVQVGITGATAISTGGSHGLAVKGDGTVWAWGANSD